MRETLGFRYMPLVSFMFGSATATKLRCVCSLLSQLSRFASAMDPHIYKRD